MKKLFMTVAFVFATTIGFADGNSSETTVSCVEVTFSCGKTGQACDYTNTADMVADILLVDSIIC